MYLKPVIFLQTALCNTALDNPGKLTKHDIVLYLLDYIPTDTLLFHSDVSMQSKPLLIHNAIALTFSIKSSSVQIKLNFYIVRELSN